MSTKEREALDFNGFDLLNRKVLFLGALPAMPAFMLIIVIIIISLALLFIHPALSLLFAFGGFGTLSSVIINIRNKSKKGGHNHFMASALYKKAPKEIRDKGLMSKLINNSK